jgi:putative redox protein
MTVTTKSVNHGGATFCAETRGHTMFCDVPQPMGGTDTAMTPVEALLGALGNCLGTVIALVCRNKGIAYEGLSVEVSAEMDEEAHRLDNFTVTVTMPGPVDEATKRAILAAESMCVVHNTLTAGAKVATIIAGA